MQGTVRGIILLGNLLPDCVQSGKGTRPDDIVSSLDAGGKPGAATLLQQ